MVAALGAAAQPRSRARRSSKTTAAASLLLGVPDAEATMNKGCPDEPASLADQVTPVLGLQD